MFGVVSSCSELCEGAWGFALSWVMRILVFGPLARAAGASSIVVDVAKGASLAEARARLTQARPELAAMVRACRFAVDHSFVADEEAVQPNEGDEVALIGLVSGG